MMNEEIDKNMQEAFEKFKKVIFESEEHYSCSEKVLNEVGLTYVINILMHLQRWYNGDFDLMIKNIENNYVKNKNLLINVEPRIKEDGSKRYV